MKMPLFPLNALVCPAGKLPLRIFEQRYLDMMKLCMKEEHGFVVVMLKDGEEVDGPGGQGTQAQLYEIGTLVRIIDFDQDDDGILRIVVEGERRVRVKSPEKLPNGQWSGEIETLAEENYVPLPEEFHELKAVLEALVAHPIVKELDMEIDYRDGRQIGWRLTELLPLDNPQKQYLYELEDPLSRLEEISTQLDMMTA